MSGQRGTSAALDAALLNKVQAFSIAARQEGVKATVHARPRVSEWARDGRSFASKVVISLTVAAAAWGALLMTQSSATKDIVKGHGAQAITEKATVAKTAQEEEKAKEDETGWKSSKFEQLRKNLNYVDVKIGKKSHQVLDAESRISLAKAVAEELKFDTLGLTWKDLYGLIHAETGWVSRTGMGNNKVASTGLAQFEPDTAKSIGLDDPQDPIQAVYGAGVLMTMAADWSSAKVNKKSLHLKKNEVHEAYREGISIYYNTSTSLRKTWNVKNTADFPDATQNHIRNLKDGALVAERMEVKLKTQVAYLNNAPIPVTQKAADSDRDAILKAAQIAQLAMSEDCAITESRLGPSTKVMHSACTNAKWLQDKAQQDPSLLGDVYAIGRTRGIPVLMATGGNSIFGAAVTAKPVSGELVVIIEKGLIEQISKDFSSSEDRALAISFVLGHETGHIEDLHKNGKVSGGDIPDEMSADSHSIDYLVSLGVSPSRAGEISSAALGSLTKFIDASTNDKELASRANSNIASRIREIDAHTPRSYMRQAHR